MLLRGVQRGAAVVAVAVAARVALKRARRTTGPVELQRSITVQLPRDEVYRRWRDRTVQPIVWSHFPEAIEWQAHVVEERENEIVRWQSSLGDLPSSGSVEFRDAPGDFGTEVTVRVLFEPLGDQVGDALAQLLTSGPKLALAKALRRFKSLVETGEIPSTARNPSARRD